MNRTSAIVAGLLAVAAVLGFLFVGGGFDREAPSDTDDLSQLPSLESVLPPEDPQSAAGRAAGEASLGRPAARRLSAQRTMDSGTSEEDGFVFTRLEVRTDTDAPEACLVFSEDLARDDSVRYGDYLDFAQEVRPAITAEGPLLCLGGLAFGETYTVTLRQGLPAASGARTEFDEVVPVELRDRPAVIAFGSGVILPRESSDGVPITTVNVDALAIRVIRVGDRLLSQLQSGLLDSRVLYGWDVQQIESQRGRVVWDGTLSVAAVRNRSVRTLFPIREALSDAQPGAYLILAENAADRDDEVSYGERAVQWVVESDLGLTSFAGTDGLTVFVRSLNSAQTLAGTEVVLVARNNEILGTARTGSDGSVRFDPGLMRGDGGMAPVMVFAYRGDDFNFLDLRRAGFDLSDRGVSGRRAPGPTDAFLYLDRGIYRPGETVEIVTMLRDDRAQALDAVPLTVIVRRPDGIEYRRQTVNQQQAGTAHLPVTLSRSAPRGRWTASAHLDPSQPPIGSVAFDVQDFVPERLEMTLSSEVAYVEPGDALEIGLEARYLYGAAAANLDGEASLRLVPDARPFPNFADYRFGLAQEQFSPTFAQLTVDRTDAQGRARVTGVVDPVPATSRILRADVTVGLFEPGGRRLAERISIPVRTRALELGIRNRFDGGGVRRGQAASFDLVALDPEGARVGRAGITWQVVREIVNYQWYQLNNEWRYERIVRDRPVAAGTQDLVADAPAGVTLDSLDYGTYRLEVADDQSGARSSVRFYVGWYGGSQDGRPDRVTVSSDQATYAVGEQARIAIAAPMTGRALVTIANDRVIDTRQVTLSGQGDTVTVPVTEDWGVGAYVMVTAYRPLSDGDDAAPVRAIGLTHLAVDQTSRTLDVSFDMPEVVAPQQQITVPVQISARDGGAAPRGAYVTLAAVDTGILNLTDFEAPAPEAHYFGKRRLGVDIRDDYGRLIADAAGQTGEIRSGGDGMADAGSLNVVPTKTVALFSGIVALDDNGQALVPLEIPDFVGELSMMAVAFSPDAVGHGEQALTIRRPVVGDMFFPRFLAPGDTGQATVQILNVDGAQGRYEAAVRVATPEAEPETVLETAVTLAPGDERRAPVDLTATVPGLATVMLDVTGPDGFALSREWTMEIREPRLPLSRERGAFLEPGTDLTLDASLLEGLTPDTATLTASLASSRGYDVPGLLRALQRYPYGCVEQTTSRAFPLLYFNEIAAASGIDTDEGLAPRIQQAVDRVLDLQRPDGAFGMWSRSGSEAALWLTVFALDFLGAAKDEGYVVPGDAMRRGNRWLGTLAEATWRDANARVYAYYVLAKRGEAPIADLRYFFDTQRGELTSGISHALLGAALDAVGDRARGGIAFTQAVSLVTGATQPVTYEALPYGSLHRDIAAVTALAAESRRTDILPVLFERAAEFPTRYAFLTTQDMAWMLLAAHHLDAMRPDDGTGLALGAEGIALPVAADPIVLNPDQATLAEGVTLTNTGDSPLWYAVTTEGVPSAAQPPAAEGLTVTKRILGADGTPADLAGVRQSERFVVLIQGRMDDNTYREMAILDLLPAGFEIETVLPAGTGGQTLYGWLPTLTQTQMASARDDRFVAAFTIGSRYQPRPQQGQTPRLVRPDFAVAYVVRAVTPGSFTVPAVRVEDMYAPRILARTGEGRLRVAPAAP